MSGRNKNVVPQGYRYLTSLELSPQNRGKLVGKKIAIYYGPNGWCFGSVLKHFPAAASAKGVIDEQFEVAYGTDKYYEQATEMERGWVVSTDDDDEDDDDIPTRTTPKPVPLPLGTQDTGRGAPPVCAVDPSPWGSNIQPQVMLNQLKKLSTDRFGKNTKPLAESYKLYDKLTDAAKNKVMKFWLNIDDNSKDYLLKTAATASTNYDQSAGAYVISDTTSKDDLCRVLHIMHDPDALVYLSKIREATQPRPVLDARHSDVPSAKGTTTFSEEGNGYIGLVNMFNDPQNKYQNICIRHNEKGERIVPFQCSD